MRRRGCLFPLFLLFAVPSLLGETYSASGVVLFADRDHLVLKVSCQAIPGYMEAMVMTFPVRNSTILDGLKPGMLIDFKLDVRKDAAYAEQIRVRAYENAAQEPMAARQLEILDAATSSSSSRVAPVLQVGQAVPDFTLIDQNRQNVTLSGLRGKVVAITFIYTRCPLPNFCFRASNNFGVLQRRFADRMGKDLVLLSITFDPEHDQPETLAEYARTWTKDATGWHFLTGPSADVKNLCREFGVNSWQDEGLLTHSLHTVIVDREGRIAANLEGNEYTAKQLGDLAEVVMTRR
ncbi:MAG TPA: SCO family protein [Candidatus Bathyarchaeia archaeon]|jgi:protein SCO1/2|nr:SCO family protein [Candidatus Bathyarchaeia archaeon]